MALAALFAYLALFSWNARTGYLDDLSNTTGLEFVGWALTPGKWVRYKTTEFWSRYVYLVGVREENDRLRETLGAASLELARVREDAAEVRRLRQLLRFSPPQGWSRLGGRVIAHELGPLSVLETILVDKGLRSDIGRSTPVVTPQGVVGRIVDAGPSFSNVLLLTDPNSRISVIGQTHRTTGIVVGSLAEPEEGQDGEKGRLKVDYIPLNAPLDEGEILVTSGLAGIFPKGLPVARVTSVERSDIYLFQVVRAEALVDLNNLEEVLLLRREEQPAPTTGPHNATAASNATHALAANATEKASGDMAANATQ